MCLLRGSLQPVLISRHGSSRLLAPRLAQLLSAFDRCFGSGISSALARKPAVPIQSGGVDVRLLLLCFFTVNLLAALARSQEASHDMSGHNHGAQAQSSMPGMDMSHKSMDWMPSPHASSGICWQHDATTGLLCMKSVDGLAIMDYV